MKTIFTGKHLLVLERDDWQYVERKKGKEAVAVVAVTDDDRIVLTEQQRKPLDARVIDYPAGLVGDEEGSDDPAETARRELEEETGFTCETLEFLAKGPTSPGITSEVVTLYRAKNLRKKGEGGGVGGEDIQVHLVPRAELLGWLGEKQQEGLQIDLKLWSGLFFLTVGE